MERFSGAAPSSDAPGTGRSGAEARMRADAKKESTHGELIKGGLSQYPEEAAVLAFFMVPRIFKED